MTGSASNIWQGKGVADLCVIATVCARGGSKGLPGKNTRLLMGRPLIEHTIDQAIRSQVINSGVYVSTDSAEIAGIAETAGAVVPFLRPAELATDIAPKVPVIEHLVSTLETEGVKPDIIVDLDPTSPLREVADIERAYTMMQQNCDLVMSVCASRKNPYFNMVEIGRDGLVRICKEAGSEPVRRQDAPEVFDINGSIYIYRRQALKKGLWGGRVIPYIMPFERSVDIDSELDFMLVELLMKKARIDSMGTA